jgi:4-hydroxy-tetrahydrodipicolinate reductase
MIQSLQFGFGTQGRWTVEVALSKKDVRLVGVIDNNPSLIGTDIGELLGIEEIGIKISSPEEVISSCKAEVVTHCTVTDLTKVFDQIKPCIEAGMSVISTSEDLSYPWLTHPQIAEKLDNLAKKHDVTVVGTGVNPGFIPDLLPLTLCGASREVERIEIRRVVDFSEYATIGPPYLGFGMSPEEYSKGVKDGVWTHGRGPLPGRVQNIQLLAAALGWNLTKVVVEYEPLLSKSFRKTPFGFDIEPGKVAGTIQKGSGYVGNEEKIRIDCFAVWSPDKEEDGLEPGNFIRIIGDPPHEMILTGGTTDRGGFVSAVRQVNLIPDVIDARSGLLTVRDLPIAVPIS